MLTVPKGPVMSKLHVIDETKFWNFDDKRWQTIIFREAPLLKNADLQFNKHFELAKEPSLYM